MTTLIAAYNSEGCIGRCDAKCHHAQHAYCQCICGGVNHGVGLKQACDNTEALAEEWMEQWQREHPDTERFEVPRIQLPLF